MRWMNFASSRMLAATRHGLPLLYRTQTLKRNVSEAHPTDIGIKRDAELTSIMPNRHNGSPRGCGRREIAARDERAVCVVERRAVERGTGAADIPWSAAKPCVGNGGRGMEKLCAKRNDDN